VRKIFFHGYFADLINNGYA